MKKLGFHRSLGLLALWSLVFIGLIFAQGTSSVVRLKGLISTSAVRPGDTFNITLVLDVQDKYHINAHKPLEDYLIGTEATITPLSGFKFGPVRYPEPEVKKLAFSEKPLAIYEGKTKLLIPVEAAKDLKPGTMTVRIRVRAQACDDQQCLQPDTLDLEISIPVVAAGTAVEQGDREVLQGSAAAAAMEVYQGAKREEPDPIADLIARRGMFLALISVFLIGLGLNTTPCVYPLIPITVGYFGGQAKGSLGRTFLLATVYVIGLAITYSILGVFAALSGALFGSIMQNPFVLMVMSGIMVALALSMFGVYTFNVSFIVNRILNKTQSATGTISALLMGLTMGFVAAPCIGPFVVALLAHVGKVGNPIYGFWVFFVMALGLGTPYLFLGAFAGSLKKLPRSGTWMVSMEHFFGVILLGMAIYFLMPLLRDATPYVFLFYFVGAGLYFILWEARQAPSKSFRWIMVAAGGAAIATGLWLVLPKETGPDIPWKPYSEQLMQQAKQEGKGVIIDVFADWCVPCHELDKFTFSHRLVQKESEKFVMIKVDVTKKDQPPQIQRLLTTYNIKGVPMVLFFDPYGRERSDLRLKGFEKPERFLELMQAARNGKFTSHDVRSANE